MLNKNKFNILIALLVVTLMPTDAFAQKLTLDGVFSNFQGSSIALANLVQLSTYAMGIFFVLSSIFKFAQLGSNPQMSPKVPLTMFVVGICLFALPSALVVVQETMAMGGGGPGDMLVSTSATLGQMTKKGIEGLLWFIRLIGYIAFVRGWLLLNQAGQGKDGALGRGLTHIFGGVAAINAKLTAEILANSIGMPLAF
jgi:intracellular multiplication protein IcmC